MTSNKAPPPGNLTRRHGDTATLGIEAPPARPHVRNDDLPSTVLRPVKQDPLVFDVRCTVFRAAAIPVRKVDESS